MPQLDFVTYASQSLFIVATFILSYLFMEIYFTPKIVEASKVRLMITFEMKQSFVVFTNHPRVFFRVSKSTSNLKCLQSLLLEKLSIINRETNSFSLCLDYNYHFNLTRFQSRVDLQVQTIQRYMDYLAMGKFGLHNGGYLLSDMSRIRSVYRIIKRK